MPKEGVPVPNLRLWRVHALLTQHQLAERAGVGTATIARLEMGAGANLLTVQRLANALHITTRKLLNETPE
jgi:transcriptional regulator with XRE-family HTH domain